MILTCPSTRRAPAAQALTIWIELCPGAISKLWRSTLPSRAMTSPRVSLMQGACPQAKAALQSGRVEACEHTPEHVGRRDAVGKVEPFLEPVAPGNAESVHIVPAIGSAQNGTDDKDSEQRMQTYALDTRIGQIREAFDERRKRSNRERRKRSNRHRAVSKKKDAPWFALSTPSSSALRLSNYFRCASPGCRGSMTLLTSSPW